MVTVFAVTVDLAQQEGVFFIGVKLDSLSRLVCRSEAQQEGQYQFCAQDSQHA
jgi:hypothetical protein